MKINTAKELLFLISIASMIQVPGFDGRELFLLNLPVNSPPSIQKVIIAATGFVLLPKGP